MVYDTQLLYIIFRLNVKGITSLNTVINWLLEDETPEVKYRTMTELLGISKDEPEVKKAYDSLLSSDMVSLVMDKFKLNKKWEDLNAFLALAEFGLTRVDVPIDDYIERIIWGVDKKSR